MTNVDGLATWKNSNGQGLHSSISELYNIPIKSKYDTYTGVCSFLSIHFCSFIDHGSEVNDLTRLKYVEWNNTYTMMKRQVTSTNFLCYITTQIITQHTTCKFNAIKDVRWCYFLQVFIIFLNNALIFPIIFCMRFLKINSLYENSIDLTLTPSL